MNTIFTENILNCNVEMERPSCAKVKKARKHFETHYAINLDEQDVRVLNYLFYKNTLKDKDVGIDKVKRFLGLIDNGIGPFNTSLNVSPSTLVCILCDMDHQVTPYEVVCMRRLFDDDIYTAYWLKCKFEMTLVNWIINH